MAYIFDGKAYGAQKEEKLKVEVEQLKNDEKYPLLISILIGDDPASRLYVNLKKKAGERVGVLVEVRSWKSDVGKKELIDSIEEMNVDKRVHGIMVQLPLPKNFTNEDREEIINSISLEKDVDGLREGSKFLHPTSKAVLEILDFALTRNYPLQKTPLKVAPRKVVVVGSTGMVGKPLVGELRKSNYELWEVDSGTDNLTEMTKEADVIISATGVENLIKARDVREGSILIDVGSPRGDIEKEAYEKSSFVSPVPGGVGPVTISCLLENLIFAAQRKTD